MLYEGDAESVSASGRPAIDVRLDSALTAETLVEVEEVAVSGWTFAADGALAASAVPAGYESREQGAYADGVSFAGHADYAEAAGLHYFDVNSSRTLAADSDGMKIVSCTGTVAVTVPAAGSSGVWFWIKNSNAGSGTVTVHPETSSQHHLRIRLQDGSACQPRHMQRRTRQPCKPHQPRERQAVLCSRQL